MLAHQSRNSIHHHNGRPGCHNDPMHTPVRPDSSQHESKPGITGPPARSCDIYSVQIIMPVTLLLLLLPKTIYVVLVQFHKF